MSKREGHDSSAFYARFIPPEITTDSTVNEPKLKPGMVFAIEPMVNVGSPRTKVLDDGWSVVTADGSLSAHFEHTIAITDNGPEILTLP